MTVYRVDMTVTVTGYVEIDGDPPVVPAAEVTALRDRAEAAGLRPALLAGALVETAASVNVRAVPDGTGELYRSAGLLPPGGAE